MLLEGKEESLLLCAAVVGSLDTGLVAVQKGSMCAICQLTNRMRSLWSSWLQRDAAGVPSPKVMDRTSEDREEDVPEDF